MVWRACEVRWLTLGNRLRGGGSTLNCLAFVVFLSLSKHFDYLALTGGCVACSNCLSLPNFSCYLHEYA